MLLPQPLTFQVAAQSLSKQLEKASLVDFQEVHIQMAFLLINTPLRFHQSLVDYKYWHLDNALSLSLNEFLHHVKPFLCLRKQGILYDRLLHMQVDSHFLGGLCKGHTFVLSDILCPSCPYTLQAE